MSSKYAQVLVDINKLGTKTFSYLIPENLKDEIKIGCAVSIPFGRRKEPLVAYVVGFSDYLEEGIKAKEIIEILDKFVNSHMMFNSIYNTKYILRNNIGQKKHF